MPPERFLIIHTAFLGDVILMLPLVQALRKAKPASMIDLLVIPRAASVLENHPDVSSVIVYDKKGKERGIGAFLRKARLLRGNRYDAVIVPHRSLRSSALAALSGSGQRIGFDISAGSFLLTSRVAYDSAAHEVDRNQSLVSALTGETLVRQLPRLYPSANDREIVDGLLEGHLPEGNGSLVAIAPGSVWNTKRWLKERFTEVVTTLVSEGHSVVLIGGREDEELCSEICVKSGVRCLNAAGKLTPLQSAELLGRAKALVSNDSAPVHMAGAMGTPVAAIFGPTVPAFGFSPLGEGNVIIERSGLSCRPCGIHGGDTCPIGTFVCMREISSEDVVATVRRIISA